MAWEEGNADSLKSALKRLVIPSRLHKKGDTVAIAEASVYIANNGDCLNIDLRSLRL